MIIDWTEKYRPKTIKEIVGNERAVEHFKRWIKDFGGGRVKKASILYGPPGVGKTSSIYALAGEEGHKYDIIELNASDQRTYKVIKRIAGSTSKTSSLEGKKKIILLDEADNLHGNADRGGAKAIGEIIMGTRHPVVLVANNLSKIPTGVKNRCKKIKFEQIKKSSISKVLMDICERENITFDDDAIKRISDKNRDLRAAINDLQAISIGKTHIGVEDVSVYGRDVFFGMNNRRDRSHFLNAIFRNDDPKPLLKMVINLDETPEDLIQWINENLFKAYWGNDLILALDCLSRADLYMGRVYSNQNYGLWRYAVDLMTTGVQLSKNKRYEDIDYSSPSRWNILGRAKKSKKIGNEVCYKVSKRYNISMKKAKMDALPYIKRLCMDKHTLVGIKKELNLKEEELVLISGIKSEIINNILKEEIKHDENVKKKAIEDKSGKARQKSVFDFSS
ncbi:MAG: Replication factor C large subunit [Candidatus Methanolliviera sp. GoM_oil]|nr:MAG: Replication factor C large subunit [Candidatus Methanolliviera sp. GoM_oil]